MLLSGLLLGGCSGGGSGSPARVVVSAGPVDRLNTAVRAVAADRTALLGSLDAVQRAATALDAADAACATGDGIAARRVHRAAEPLVGPAAAAVR
ncbi:MAG: hypothetical protein ACXVGH_07900, partial [Mycobacteriales bacterium]